MIPKAITRELIETSPSVFTDLCLYVAEVRSPRDGTVPDCFPEGLRRILLIVNMDTAVHNGGLWGYFGDITNEDGSVDEVCETIRVLRAMNAQCTAAVLEEAWEIWRDFVAIYLPARSRDPKSSFEEFQLSRVMRDEMESRLDPLDERYYQSHTDLVQVIGIYARKHVEEFLHPV